MQKILLILLVFSVSLILISCGKAPTSESTEETSEVLESEKTTLETIILKESLASANQELKEITAKNLVRIISETNLINFKLDVKETIVLENSLDLEAFIDFLNKPLKKVSNLETSEIYKTYTYELKDGKKYFLKLYDGLGMYYLTYNNIHYEVGFSDMPGILFPTVYGKFILAPKVEVYYNELKVTEFIRGLEFKNKPGLVDIKKAVSTLVSDDAVIFILNETDFIYHGKMYTILKGGSFKDFI